jgi:hypothetical protein
MDDAMLDLMADHGELRRRLGAYAESRLSPDLAASTRMRARVLAVAHRQSALLRADPTLALVADPLEVTGATAPTTSRTTRVARSRPAWRRAATLLLAAGLAVTVVSGAALAARPGGALYGARVWVETLTLPVGPKERAIAELARLDQRLLEVAQANASGDAAGAEAALVAYQGIADQAASAALLTGDQIAILAIETGVANNIVVLGGLVSDLPATASEAVQRALERAIARSQDTIDTIDAGQGAQPGSGPDSGTGAGAPSDPGSGGAGGQPVATDAPTAQPTPKATKAPKPDATAEPEPTAKPEPSAKPAPTAKPALTAKPGPPDDGARRTPDPGSGAQPTPRGQGG